jgi:hypothetical protein
MSATWYPQKGDVVAIVAPGYTHRRGKIWSKDDDGWLIEVEPGVAVCVPENGIAPAEEMTGKFPPPNMGSTLQHLAPHERMRVRVASPRYVEWGKEGTVYASRLGKWVVKLDDGS